MPGRLYEQAMQISRRQKEAVQKDKARYPVQLDSLSLKNARKALDTTATKVGLYLPFSRETTLLLRAI